MNETKVILELSPDDRALLKRIADALHGVGLAFGVYLGAQTRSGSAETETTPLTSPVQPRRSAEAEPAQVSTVDSNDAPAASQAAQSAAPEAPAAVEPAGEPPAALEEIRQLVVRLVQSGKKPEVLSIVRDYAERVTDIPEDKRTECRDRLAALAGKEPANG